jgi:hypothetical protein
MKLKNTLRNILVALRLAKPQSTNNILVGVRAAVQELKAHAQAQHTLYLELRSRASAVDSDARHADRVVERFSELLS